MDRIWKFSAPAPFFSSLFRPGVISRCICPGNIDLGNICQSNICLGNIDLGNIDLGNRRPEGVL
ncbi:MAG: hypothetical protein ACK5V1_19750 [Planctomycetaceae bacterium]